MEWSDRTKKVIVVLVIVAAAVLFLHQLLVPNRLVYQGDLTSSDITELNFPRRDFLSRSLKDGEIPVWTNLIGNGYPLLGEGQGGVLYPPNLILFGLLDSVTAYNLTILLSFILCMAFMYLFARSLERSRTASIFAAIAFTMSAFFISRLKFMAMTNAAAWLPLVLYGIQKLYLTRKLRYAALSGFGLAMQILAGQTQIFYISALLAICFLLFRFSLEAWSARKKRDEARRAVRLGAIALVLLVILAFALPAIQLIPAIDAIDASNRASGLTFWETTIFPMRPANLVMFVLPYHYGNPATASYHDTGTIFWENCAYCGVITLLLAVLAILTLIRKESDVPFWLGTAVMAILLALGRSTPVFRFFWRWLPGMGLFRFPQRFLLVAVVAIVVLAARGLDRVTEKPGARSAVIGTLAVAIVVAELAVFSAYQVNTIDSKRLLSPPRTMELIEEGGQPGQFRIGHIGQLDSWRKTYQRAEGWMGDLQPYLNYRTLLPFDFNMVFDVEDSEAQGHYGVGRIKTLWGWTYDSVATDESNWTARVPNSVVRILGAQNVRYVLSPYSISNEYLEPLSAVTFPDNQRGVLLYRNRLEQPRVSVVGDYRLIEDPDNALLTSLFNSKFDPAGEVLLEKTPTGCFEPGGSGEAKISQYGNREVTVDVTTRGSGLLVLSDTFYPGWKAYLDGREVEILRANYAFRAVEVGDGSHRVRFSYTPDYYSMGIAVTSTSAALLLLGLVLCVVRDRKDRRKPENETALENGEGREA